MATNVYRRWSQQKLAPPEQEPAAEQAAPQRQNQATPDVSNDIHDRAEAEPEQPETLTLDDANKVTFASGVAAFLKPGVTQAVRQQALQRLFHAAEFNYISDMDDHVENFANLPALDSQDSGELRNWLNDNLENKVINNAEGNEDNSDRNDSTDAMRADTNISATTPDTYSASSSETQPETTSTAEPATKPTTATTTTTTTTTKDGLC